jgi:Protein of unknown function (DUF3365)
MKLYRFFLPLCLLLCPLAQATEISELEEQASALAAEFIGRLKPQLKQAMEAGGPVNAIDVCSEQAPIIADALSAESGWLVRRVSLNARNASRALPDSWERAVLVEFDRRQANGESPANIKYSEASNSSYRYMQAQGTQGLCLVCHGQQIAPEVQQTLDQYYPDDTATGYSLGQIRGAISLAKTL